MVNIKSKGRNHCEIMSLQKFTSRVITKIMNETIKE